LLDAEILAEVYLAMTGGQASLGLGAESSDAASNGVVPDNGIRRLAAERKPLTVLRASPEETERHEAKLRELDLSAGEAIWRRSPRH
jgi:DNA polymerase-3 subunit epsilon